MPTRSPAWCLLAVLTLAACAVEEPSPGPSGPAPPPAAGGGVTPETARLEGIARRLAVALADPGFRGRLYARLTASPFREGKIHLQRTFAAGNRSELAALSKLNAESERTTDSLLRDTQPLEVYLPVPAHRAAWQGDARLLVATAARDGDPPVAYDLRGRRHLLDPARPPQTPVLAVVPVETDFDHPPLASMVACPPDIPGCREGGGGGGSPGAALVLPGLYMTRAHFNQDFEGWLKGSPEFEIHIMGQKGGSDSLTKYQCAGEHQPGSYYWDGDTDWSGSVLLFSQTELNNYHLAHPGETLRLVALEDDDTSCQIKVGQDRWATFVASIGPLYRDMTGATDSGNVKKYLTAAKSLRNFLSAIGSLIKTNDDLIGTALEDRVVGEFHPGYNWILRADNNVTNGYINLEMR
jgi:hypothetical protein